MVASKVKKSELVAQKWDNLDRWVKRVLGAVATIGTIVGLISGALAWSNSQLDAHLDQKIDPLLEQIEKLSAESEVADKEQRLSITRLELTTLISHNPTNVLEIEKVARYYFMDLGGDWYMSKIYSDWAKEYGGDTSFVAHKG